MLGGEGKTAVALQLLKLGLGQEQDPCRKGTSEDV